MGISVMDCGPSGAELRELAPPQRNRYYYGKLLDEYHLRLEQEYGNAKRWLINRLSLGAGVLCGLEVVSSADGDRVRVRPGVAIDGLGREIVVDDDSPAVDPRQPTDECGRPDGVPVRGAATVTLYVCYHECLTEPARALVSKCGTEPECENGIVRERYRLRIREGEPAPPGLVTPDQCTQIFAQLPPRTTRREVLCRTLPIACDPPEEECVPLAVLRLNEDGRVVAIESCAFRRTLYSNAVLLDLILCLASRVDECCGALAVKSIMIVSGDNQTGPVGEPLADPLVVRVAEGGAPVDDEQVTFDVVPGGGDIGDAIAALAQTFVTRTTAAGIATLPIWRLGPNAGAQRVTARIADGTPAMVTFTARAEPKPVDLPVVRVIWPTNAVSLARQSADPVARDWWKRWLGAPRIELTFNHKMNAAQLGKPEPWLRVFVVQSFGQNEIRVAPLAVAYAGPAAQPVLAAAGFTEGYALRGLEPGMLGERATRFLVQIRADGNSIVDTAAPTPQLLDAEFEGTLLARPAPVVLEEIWKLTGPRTFPQAVWDAFVDTGARLPQSGNGAEGGLFHSWFEVLGPG
jgi:hypothetical protein